MSSKDEGARARLTEERERMEAEKRAAEGMSKRSFDHQAPPTAGLRDGVSSEKDRKTTHEFPFAASDVTY